MAVSGESAVLDAATVSNAVAESGASGETSTPSEAGLEATVGEVEMWAPGLVGATMSSIITSWPSTQRAGRAEITRPFLRHFLSRSMEGAIEAASSSVAESPCSASLTKAARHVTALGALFLFFAAGVTWMVASTGVGPALE